MKNGSVGFYGKLPIVGDFITRRLPKDFVNSLDQWMQNGITVSKEELQGDWLDLYLTAPIWRFAFQSGVCGEGAWVGIIMPSVDKVGRYYPLTLAYPLDKDDSLALILVKCSDWFGRLEDIALAGLEESYNLDEFNDSVLELGAPYLNFKQHHKSNKPSDQLTTHLVSEYHFIDKSITLAEAIMMASFEGTRCKESKYSLWINNGNEEELGAVKIFNGLPSAQDYSKMIG